MFKSKNSKALLRRAGRLYFNASFFTARHFVESIYLSKYSAQSFFTLVTKKLFAIQQFSVKSQYDDGLITPEPGYFRIMEKANGSTIRFY